MIITCPRHHENDAAQESTDILYQMGDDTFSIQETGISGIITGQTCLDPIWVSRKAADMIHEEPWAIRYIRRIIPVCITVRTDIRSISDAIPKVITQMKPHHRYRISVEKRNTTISRTDIIKEVAAQIPNQVSLSAPDRIIQIEILGGISGISLLQPGDIFSLYISKRAISEE